MIRIFQRMQVWRLNIIFPRLQNGQIFLFAISEESVHEAGCIHTSQGLEFDYTGVIIGDDMRFENGKVITDYTKRAKTDNSLKGVKTLAKKDKEKADRVADVLVYSQNLLDKLELDADEIVNMKMKQNEAKYPVDKAKGNATKYTELQLMRKMMCLSRCCYAKINKVMPESKNLQRLTKPEKPRKTKKCEVMQQ